jgi:hypothetical protein
MMADSQSVFNTSGYGRMSGNVGFNAQAGKNGLAGAGASIIGGQSN